MTEIRSFMNLLFSLVLIILCIISQCLAALSDKQLCYNPDCSEPISLAKTAIVYISNDREVMSFNAGTEVKVFSKGAGKRTDLWGVEINGKRGFAPRSLLVEYKVLQRKLQYEVPVYKFTGEVNEVQPTELESRTEEKHKTHPLLKNKLLHDIEATSKSVKSIDESIVQESQVINVDNIISYEVIDGTTLYSDNEPSIQPNFVSKVVQATALPNEQASIDFIDSKINPDHKEPLSDKSTFIKKELQTDANDANGKLDKTKLSLDVHKETSTEILLENSAGLISLTLDTVSKDDTLIYDEGNKSEDELSTNLEHKEKSDNKIKTDNNAEESIEDNKKEEIMESVESKDIFASFTETFKMFSSSQDTTESTTIQNDDIPVSKAENNFQLKQVSEDIEAKDIASEKHIPTIQTELDSSIDSSLISKEKIEIQQEIIHENIESANVLDEKTKIEKEASIILLENATSSSDVPLSNNFVHKDTAKPAKKLPTTSSIEVDDSTTSSKTDINNIKNIQIGETSKEEKIIENIEDIDGSFVKDSIISGLKETTVIKSASTQSNSEVEQKLSENDKTHPEEDVSHTKTFDQVTINNKISETTNLSPETAIKENTKELFSESHTVEKNVMIDESLNHSATDISFIEKFVYSNVNKNDNSVDSLDNVPIEPNQFSNDVTPGILDSDQSLDSSQKEISNQITNFNEILQNQNLSDVEEDLEHEKDQFVSPVKEKETLLEYDDYINSEDKVLYKDEYTKEDNNLKKPESKSISDEIEDKVPSFDEYTNEVTTEFLEQKEESENEEDNLIDLMKLDNNYWKTLMFLCVTSVTVLVFTLGYYYIENIRRDKQLIARINTLEKEQLDLTLYIESIQEALSTQNESTEHNSNRFYEAKHRADKAEEEKTKLEEQVTVLEKDLENATEAGLELERMLREVLSSNNEINPLAQSVEDLKARLDAQQTANESLTNALNLKAQEIETLSADLVTTKKKYEELEIEFSRVQDELAILRNLKNNIEETLTDKVHNLEEQLDELVMEKSLLYKELKGKEIEIKELMEIVNQVKSNNLDLEKLYDVSHIKVDAQQLREERDELKMRLSDVEGAHQLLEEHMKLVKEEITALSDQCKIAEKEKKDAETRLEVLSKFFKEKEAERQKEETMWLQKQGEVVSTVERIHTMQSEIQNYKQQIEILKREIMDQEREYKNQISALETKAHEQWVAARQNERRLEESKAAAGQLRNRLTLVEKNLNLNDTDSEIKLHRLEANGETVTSPPLFMGAESSSSPVMFSGSSGVPPPPPPSYLHCFPPYLPPLPPTTSGLPPYDISQRPPPLGGRLSSPPPMPPPLHPQLTSGGRYENTSSPPPPMTPPHLLPSFNHHRSPLSLPFGDDRIPPLPPPGFPPPLGTTHPWGEESLPVPRNSGFHPHQREQRARNHKGSLHSSGESLDQKAHHGKI
ncbi:transport and Golgi organization protein 1 [Camponotus floridanus]|uniref:transport and Golgi organization protein 1 n=1 Tax=Camponotus floridanus TaxID=104421 RepID=UPI000DC6A606|nr:transport and Golgi organization protein 1 [Camponotus floridanus]